MIVSIGFTGTRFGMTPEQRANVALLVEMVFRPFEDPSAIWYAHHGDCIGADAEFHDICRPIAGSRIIVHPGPADDVAHQAGRVGDERRENKTHMRRNGDIVAESTVMIATPLEMFEQQMGGTWRTIGMARKKKRLLAICWADGKVSRENW